MKLKKVLERVDYKLLKGNIEVEVCDLAYDSRKVMDGYIFVCLVGNDLDGHDYIDNAIRNGAKAIILCREIDVPSNISVVLVDDTSKVLSRLSMNLLDNPHKKLTTIAITDAIISESNYE